MTKKIGGWLIKTELPIGFDTEKALMDFLGTSTLAENEETVKCLDEDIRILQYRRGLLERVVEKQKRKEAKKKE